MIMAKAGKHRGGRPRKRSRFVPLALKIKPQQKIALMKAAEQDYRTVSSMAAALIQEGLERRKPRAAGFDEGLSIDEFKTVLDAREKAKR
jgi:hypothetical protein